RRSPGNIRYFAQMTRYLPLFVAQMTGIAPFRDGRAVTMTEKLPGRQARIVAAVLAAGAVLAAAGAHPASAQGRLEAQYEATLAGISVGKGAWNIEIGEDSYAASAIGGTSGLLKTIANGSGDGEAQGRIINGALVPANYKASTTTSKKSETIHITLAGGNVREFGIDPVPPVDAD